MSALTLVRYGGDSYLFSLLRLLPQWAIAPLGRYMAKTAAAYLRGELRLKPP